MGTTGAGVPAPLVAAYQAELLRESPDLERRHFLRTVAESAVGSLPAKTDAVEPSTGRVPVEDAVALAVGVLRPFGQPPEADAEPSAPVAPPTVTGRAAATELARRVRRLPGRMTRRLPGRPR